jgi:fimbrial chaperone protein
MRRSRTIGRATAFSWLLSIASAQAAGLQVTPTGLTLSARQNADGLWLSNSSSEPLHAQVRAFRWSQAGDEDRLEPTRDLIVSPPALQLPPGERQLVRVIRAGPPPSEGETSYRVIVDELPVPADGDSRAARGLRFVLQYSLPVFLLSAASPSASGPGAPSLDARLMIDAGRWRLQIANRGDRHAQLADLSLVDRTGRRHVLGEGLAGYVLAGQQRTWALPQGLQASSLDAGAIDVRVNGERLERALQPPSADAPTR